jgi:hypothetical protein
MSPSNPTLSDMQHAVRDTVRLHWQLFLTQGVIMIILGVLAVVWPQISTIAVDVYVGWLFLLSGIVGLASMFLARNVQAFLWSLLTGGALVVRRRHTALASDRGRCFAYPRSYSLLHCRRRLPAIARCSPTPGVGCWQAESLT